MRGESILKRAEPSIDMKNAFSILIALVGLCCAPAFAIAQERLGDGAMGAVAGALVGGPVGLVAGGVIGYTAGPGIAGSWGLRHHRHGRRHYAHAHRHPVQ
jgi:hypothetical protein